MALANHYHDTLDLTVKRPIGVEMLLHSLRITLKTWRQRAIQRRQLAELPDHLLKDIGLDRHDVKKECRKAFWQD